MLVTAALNGNATAAVGLVAPGLERLEIPGPPGLIVDPNTHIPGLVAAKTPRANLRARPDPDARADVEKLAAELHNQRDARVPVNVVVGIVLGLLGVLALGSRAALWARATVLYAPAAIGLGLIWRSWIVIGFGALGLALVAALPRRAFVPLVFAVIAGALLILWQWPVTNSLATIGPHPDGGHRFYGVTNQVETMLLAPALVAGLAAAPLALVMVGWSKAGADGGGLAVYAVGYSLLALRTYGHATWRRVALAAGAALALAVASIAVDAATGGSSHVTHSLGRGLPGDLAHRWRVSYDGATRSWGAFIMFASGVVLLAFVALARPRPRVVDAMLVALLVSFVVNDTPMDVALWGALGAIALLAFERNRVR